MPIIARANPGDITRIAPLPGVRNEARVSAAPAAALADAVRSTTSDVAEVYQREQDRVDTAAYMGAQQKLSDWRSKWEDPNNAEGIQKYKGNDALKLRDTMLPDYDKTVSEVASSLPSQRAREKFMQFAADNRGQVYDGINRYAGAQHDSYIAGQRKAYLQTQADSLVRAQLTDPNEYKQKWAVTLDTIHADAAANGDSPEATALTVRNMQSTVHVGVLSQLMTTSPTAAQAYYAEHADEMMEDDRAQVLRTLHPLYEDARAAEDADAAVAGGAFHSPGSRAPNNHEAIQRDYRSLSERFGMAITSAVRTPEENTRVGGVANSQHPAGTAADFRTRDVPPAKVEAFMAAARAAGYEVVDEREHTKGTGPHIHLELPGAPVVAGQGIAGEMATALERLQGIRDPARRRAAEAKVRDRFEVAKLRQDETERQQSEAVSTAVWTAADPTLPLAQVLGPEGFAYAARKGIVGQLTNDLKFRAENPARADDPKVVGAYLDELRRNPDSFARMDVMKNARHMTDSTANALVQKQKDIREGKGEEFATENAQLDALMFGPLKMLGETQAAKNKRAPIEAAWYQLKAEWSAANPNKKLDAQTRDAMIRRLRTSFALNKTSGFEAFAMKADDRAAIVAQLQRRGIANPTNAQIERVYLIGIAQ